MKLYKTSNMVISDFLYSSREQLVAKKYGGLQAYEIISNKKIQKIASASRLNLFSLRSLGSYTRQSHYLFTCYFGNCLLCRSTTEH